MLIKDASQIIHKLLNNKIGIIPTDTIYGFITLFSNDAGIKKIFEIKKRPIDKKIPILVASFQQLEQFVHVDDEIKKYLLNFSQPTTVIYPLNKNLSLDLKSNFFANNTIAIRLVRWKWLEDIILKTGPLVATSCNLTGELPIIEEKLLLGFLSSIDFIVAKKPLQKKPSPIFDWKTKTYLR